MRKYTALLLSLLLLASALLAACERSDPSLLADGTPRIEPTEDEMQTVMTIGNYTVTYDVFRYFFLNFKAQYDGGNAGVWSDPEVGAPLREALLDSVVSALRHLAAVDKLSAYAELPSDSIDQSVSDYVLSFYRVECKEDLSSYKETLEQSYLSDHAFREITRLAYTEDLLSEYLVKTDRIDSSDDAAHAAIEGDAFLCVKQILIQNDEGDDPEENRRLAEEVLGLLEEGAAFSDLITRYSEDRSAKNTGTGYYFTKYQYLEEFEEAAFALEIGEHSGIVETELGYSIILRCPKDSGYLNANYDTLKEAYLASAYHAAVEQEEASLRISYEGIYSLLTIETVK